ncbi:MAG: CPBP family intramembrane metalloprotease [Anaerolineae bacterium]|nr:CPBP family intramembrane metalloprotease [Anaerolineae bacterium]
MPSPHMRQVLHRIFIKDRRLHPLWRASFYLSAYVLVTLVVQIAALSLYMLYSLSKGVTPLAVGQAILGGPSPTWLELVLTGLGFLVVLVLTYLFRRFLDGKDFVTLGFRRQRLLLDTAFGLALGFVLMAGIFFVEWGLGLLAVEHQVWDERAIIKAVGDVSLALLFFAIAGANEEIVFRGYVLPNLTEGMGRVAAVIVSSLVFGVFHVWNPNVSFIAIVNISLAGVVFAYAYLLSGNLWLPMALHFSWNFFQGAVFSLPVSGIVVRGLLETHPRPGADWITGGAFGPEAGLSGLVALLLAGVFLWLWSRTAVRHQGGEAHPPGEQQ